MTTPILRYPADSRLGRAVHAHGLAVIERALRRHDGNRSAAAEWLGVSRSYLAEVLAAHPEIVARYPGTPGRRAASE